jgi:hypothetical protein
LNYAEQVDKREEGREGFGEGGGVGVAAALPRDEAEATGSVSFVFATSSRMVSDDAVPLEIAVDALQKFLRTHADADAMAICRLTRQLQTNSALPMEGMFFLFFLFMKGKLKEKTGGIEFHLPGFFSCFSFFCRPYAAVSRPRVSGPVGHDPGGR